MLILNIFLYRKSSKYRYFSRKTYSKYSRRVRTTAPPDVARLNTEIPCITHLDIYSNIYGLNPPRPDRCRKVGKVPIIDFDQSLVLSRLSCACVVEGDSTVLNSFVRLRGLKFSAQSNASQYKNIEQKS
jgi:hypothetical protein